jgi:5-methylcytosine-specific restriction endonuclease McrA
MARNYQRENLYKAKPQQIKAREERNTARRIMQTAGLVHKGDGKEVDHIVPISKGGKTVRSNLRVVSASTNDSFKRNSKKQLVSQVSTKEARRGRK